MIFLHGSLLSELVRSARYFSYRQLFYWLAHHGYLGLILLIGFGGWYYFKKKCK